MGAHVGGDRSRHEVRIASDESARLAIACARIVRAPPRRTRARRRALLPYRTGNTEAHRRRHDRTRGAGKGARALRSGAALCRRVSRRARHRLRRQHGSATFSTRCAPSSALLWWPSPSSRQWRSGWAWSPWRSRCSTRCCFASIRSRTCTRCSRWNGREPPTASASVSRARNSTRSGVRPTSSPTPTRLSPISTAVSTGA